VTGIEFERLPDLCPVCGSSGLAPCYNPEGVPWRDHEGRPTAYAARTESPEESAAIVDANLRAMGSEGTESPR
jgi:hypothetical protein